MNQLNYRRSIKEVKKFIKIADTPDLQAEVRLRLEELFICSNVSLRKIAEDLGFEIQEGRRGVIQILVFQQLEKKLPPLKISLPENKDAGSKEICFSKIDETFLPPDKQEMNEGGGSGQINRPSLYPRTQLAIDVLGSMGIDLLQCKFLEGKNTENMVRNLSYRAIVILEINCSILVCDEEGNKTFVIYSANKIEQFYNLKKCELSKLENSNLVASLIWQEAEVWQAKLAALLIAAPLIDGSADKQSDLRDKKYYENPIYLRVDFEEFARELGEGKTVFDLCVGNIYSKRIICHNGEKVSGQVYLIDAGEALGIISKGERKEGNKMRVDILKILFKNAGIELRGKKYYENPEYVKKDLRVFAKELGEGKAPTDLSTWNMASLEIICCNGEKVKGTRYLSNAGIALGIAKESRKSLKNMYKTLNILLEKAGYEAKALIPSNKAYSEYAAEEKDYYGNSAYIKKDLEAFVNELDEGAEVDNLTAGAIETIEITCCNGEKLKGNMYLNRAGVALGMAKNGDEARSIHNRILIKLMKIAGFELKEYQQKCKAYYINQEIVRNDFEAFAVELGEGMTTEDLTSSNIRDLEIICCNGEKINGNKYILNAGVTLEMVKNTKEAQSIKALIFKKLMETAGFTVNDLLLTRKAYVANALKYKDYYENPDYMRRDLESFARELGEGKTPMDLSTWNMETKTITCCNGEKLNGDRYLRRAVVALGIAPNAGGAKGKRTDVLKMLIKKAGFEVCEIIRVGDYKKEALKYKDYYENPDYMRRDLESFARELGEGKTPMDLSTWNMETKTITCCNGEKLNGSRYLSKAAVALGKANTGAEGSKKRVIILKVLKETAGYKEKKYEPRNKDYYENPDYMRRDLESFTRELGEGKTPMDLSTWNMASKQIICCNGEKIKGEPYLLNAGVRLGMAKTTRKAKTKVRSILDELLKKAGYIQTA